MKYVRKLTKVGKYSYTVVIPREVISLFRWQEGQRVELTVFPKSKRVTIKDWKK